MLYMRIIVYFLFLAAGNAFCESAVIQLRAGTKHEAATNYCDAATCYRKADPNGKVLLLLYECTENLTRT